MFTIGRWIGSRSRRRDFMNEPLEGPAEPRASSGKSRDQVHAPVRVVIRQVYNQKVLWVDRHMSSRVVRSAIYSEPASIRISKFVLYARSVPDLAEPDR